MLNSAVDLLNFDPDIVNVVVSFLGVAGKYAMIFGISTVVLKMVVRTATGKERLL